MNIYDYINIDHSSFQKIFYDSDIIYFLILLQAYLVYKYTDKEDSHQQTTMLSKGSKQKYSHKPSTGFGSINTSVNNSSCNYNYSDRVDDAECESLLEKDIQVCIGLIKNCNSF